ncbi:hypothetical protein [Sphingomonas sp. M1-B02]|uniref:hypothetical protein n=1 Tax=Sphingomonas sp. M1-B02 TaxID=3114300 RepID=UPI00223F4EA5|nr:hypothetical protein [Sphingomonas sp. S6-11]UZK67259.1 hypothetical protein OKW87_05350 [Sphingomonas sp. S6-11]
MARLSGDAQPQGSRADAAADHAGLIAMRWTLLALAAASLASPAPAQPIDRRALVGRHAVLLDRVDRHAPLMLGNGNLGFTADITGLQTFPEQYSSIAPLLTMAQWAWHSFPNPIGYGERDGMVMVPVPGRGARPFPWIRDWAEIEARPALKWLRENPHRFSLGRIGLAFLRRDGSRATFADIASPRQRLDLWSGALTSNFAFDGAPVTVETRVHPNRDMVMVRIRSRLVASGRIGVDLRYPGISAQLNPDPSDWGNDAGHRTHIVSQRPGALRLERSLDDSRYHSAIAANGPIAQSGPHAFRATSRTDTLTVTVSFDRAPKPPGGYDPAAVSRHWRDYWTRGGIIDFSGSSDPRAAELERRIVLSQYLAAINQAGSLPPQEEGLFSNSWNGKFHLEMHPLHAAHWASWGRPDLLERSLAWYLEALPHARETARAQGVQGAWWSKMTGPEGRNSPSTVNPFIMWQQPHPIYLAELVYRARATPATLARYAELVDQTARLLASWPRRDEAAGRFVLGPPIIPVQENHPPLTTVNPTFELEYYRWALATAQQWRERRGLAREPHWDRVIAQLAPPPQRDGLYLPVESAPDFWHLAATPGCSGHAGHGCLNRDHPSFLMAYGLIPGRVDREIMRRTLATTTRHWDLRQTWGWDFPIVAMTAARLGDPEAAIDWLLRDAPNNRWGVSGMTPRVHLEAERQLVGPAAAGEKAGPEGPGFARAAETYFPSNGALLLATGMMAAGWEGSSEPAPGFPRKGWNVRVERIRPLH